MKNKMNIKLKIEEVLNQHCENMALEDVAHILTTLTYTAFLKSAAAKDIELVERKPFEVMEGIAGILKSIVDQVQSEITFTVHKYPTEERNHEL